MESDEADEAEAFWRAVLDGLLALVVETDECGEERIAYVSAPLLARTGYSAEAVRDLYLATKLIAPDGVASERAAPLGWAGAATLLGRDGLRRRCALQIRPLAFADEALEACELGALSLWAVAPGAPPRQAPLATSPSTGAAQAPSAPTLEAVLAFWQPLLSELLAAPALVPIARSAPAPSRAQTAALDALLDATYARARADERRERCEQARALLCGAAQGLRGGRAARALALPAAELGVVGLLPLWDACGRETVAVCCALLVGAHARALGPYALAPGAALGRGSVALVRAATRAPDGARVALKSIELGPCAPHLLERTWAEVDTLRHLAGCAARGSEAARSAARIGWLLDCVAGPRALHLVLARAPGVDLQTACEDADARAAPLAPAARRALFAQLARAVRWLHAHGVCHRDVKPANAVVDLAARTLVLVDFNCARVLEGPADLNIGRDGDVNGGRGQDGGDEGRGRPRPGACSASSPVHTPLYAPLDVLAACAAAEPARYDAYGADVWGCGCVLLQLALAGEARAGGLVKLRSPAPAGELASGCGARQMRDGLARARESGCARGAELRLLEAALVDEPRARAAMEAIASDEYVAGAEVPDGASSFPLDAGAPAVDYAWRYDAIVWRRKQSDEL